MKYFLRGFNICIFTFACLFYQGVKNPLDWENVNVFVKVIKLLKTWLEKSSLIPVAKAPKMSWLSKIKYDVSRYKSFNDDQSVP